jgi:hypothetical protein
MRISFAQRIDVPAVHTVRRTAVTTTAQQPAQLLYFLDDAPLASDVLQGGILIPDGSHTLIVTTRDYQRSSLPLAVRGGMPSVAVQLYPVRSISGRIAVSDPEDFVRPPELDGIEVQLIPGTAATSTDAGGSFHLPPAAVTPGAQLHIVDESLPEGLSAGDAATVKDGTVTVFVHATRRIERLKHRSSLP